MTDGVPDGLRRLADVVDKIGRHDQEVADSLYDATDGAGLVEVTLNGRGRLVGLTLDDRLLGLGAQEAALRINQTAWAALELIDHTYAETAPELQAEVERTIATLPPEVQDQIRRSSGYADGAPAS